MSLSCSRAALAALALAACGDNHATPPDAAAPDAPDAPTLRAVELAFMPVVGTQPFACGQTYAGLGADATTITPRDFRIYVHDVELVRADGTRAPLALEQDGAWQYQNVALLDFEDFTGGCADGTPETHRVLRGTVPAGAYIGVAFTVGIPDTMNHVDLTSMPAPLDLTGLWWGWAFGHIFLAVVAHADVATPTPGTNDFYFHIGATGCTGAPEQGEQVTCTNANRPRVELTGFDPTAHAITVDYAVPLAHAHLATSEGCHSFTADTCTDPFAAVGLDFATGVATPANQHLFRIDP